MYKCKRLFVLALMFMTTGCVTVGKDFNFSSYDSLPLEIGKTTIDSVITDIGDPPTKSTSTRNGEKYETFKYIFAGNQTKVLFVEFKSEILNAYVAIIRGKETGLFDAKKIKLISEDTSNKTSVEGLLGKPQGKALCLTLLYDYRYLCKRGVEIWRWYGVDNKKELTYSIVFDNKEIVSYVETK